LGFKEEVELHGLADNCIKLSGVIFVHLDNNYFANNLKILSIKNFYLDETGVKLMFTYFETRPFKIESLTLENCNLTQNSLLRVTEWLANKSND
jgi:adenine specific DNA methylase Mod